MRPHKLYVAKKSAPDNIICSSFNNWSDKMVNLSNEALVAGVSVLAVLGISWLVILCTRKSRLRKAAGREQRRQRINTSRYDAAAAERWASSSTAPLVPPPAT